MPYLLYPLRLVVRPYLAPNALAFLYALGPALLLLLLHYGWVVRSNVAFEEASVEASRKLAEKVAAVRAGNWQAAQKQPRRKRPPFKLRPTGPPAVALLWKNLISAGQAFTLRVWLSLAVFAVFASIGFGQASGGSGVRPVAGDDRGRADVLVAAHRAAVLRQDFRQDLPLADMLKTYPLRGWQLALGELLAPAAVLTGIQWFLLILVFGLFCATGCRELGWPCWLGLGFGAALIIPMLNLITLQIPNAATLLFPAWFQAAKGGGAGHRGHRPAAHLHDWPVACVYRGADPGSGVVCRGVLSGEDAARDGHRHSAGVGRRGHRFGGGSGRRGHAAGLAVRAV